MTIINDQHFLRSEGALYQIVKATDVQNTDTIYEIGPGPGILTLEILKKNPKKLLSCEIDSQFIPQLSMLKEEFSQFDFVIQSTLHSDLSYFNKVIGNIPYSLTESIYEQLLDSKVPFIVLLHGKKFYDTITTKAVSKWYHFVNAFYTITKITGVPGDLFEPPTKVSSTVVKLLLKKDLGPYDLLVQELFKKRTRTVLNALLFSFVEVLHVPKKLVKEKISLGANILSKQLSLLSNDEFQLVIKELELVLISIKK